MKKPIHCPLGALLLSIFGAFSLCRHSRAEEPVADVESATEETASSADDRTLDTPCKREADVPPPRVELPKRVAPAKVDPEPKLEVLLPRAPMRTEKRDAYWFDAWQRPVGLVVGGAGVVSLGVAGAFVVNALTKSAAAAQRSCIAPCTPRERTDDGVRSAGRVAAVAAVTGFTLAGAGAILYLTAPKPPGMRELKFTPTFAAGGGGGIAARASF